MGPEGRDPHPTALRVVQEIKRMRSRAASAAEALGPYSEGAQAGGQPCAPSEVEPSAVQQVGLFLVLLLGVFMCSVAWEGSVQLKKGV